MLNTRGAYVILCYLPDILDVDTHRSPDLDPPSPDSFCILS